MTMLKKTLCVAALGMGVSVGYLAWATAPGDGEPPPPPSLNDCTPGFWKNHPEWIAQYCNAIGDDGAACVNDAIADLTAKGHGSEAIRNNRASQLNAWADSTLANICPD